VFFRVLSRARYNDGMDESQTDDRPSDDIAEKLHIHLQCVGSFKAYTQAGELHTIEIWTHFGDVHDREGARVSPSLLVLTTTDGHGVDRVDQGEYHLTDNPEVSLSTDDPNAP
jgi:hypothetical protein